jgi:hypothetical protein
MEIETEVRNSGSDLGAATASRTSPSRVTKYGDR